ncbi:MAG TPA: aspartate aminotransferase [Spirochaetaceae bacterium]|nr:aspartate aminotransferase [Spirochaetaceae bacterium]
MPSLSQRAGALKPSATIAMNQRARELKAGGADIIDLTVGEPDFRPPSAVLQAASRLALSGADRYTPVAGIPELRAAAADSYRADGGLSYAPEQLMVSPGAKSALTSAILALINPGDEAIIPVPAWLSYAEQVKLAGGHPVLIATGADSGYKLSPRALRAALSPRTKLLILCSPSNPTGAVYSAAELEALAAVLHDRPELWVLSDEVYRAIRYVADAPSPAALPELYGRCVVVRGLSKSHAMTGWRIGFAAGPKPLMDACIAIQGQSLTCAAALSQLAGLEALRGDQAEARAMVEAYAQRRAFMTERLAAMPGLRMSAPDGAFYAYPRAEALLGKTDSAYPLNSSDELALYLLNEAGVALVPGSAFGDDGALRISFAAADGLLYEALARMDRALAKLA